MDCSLSEEQHYPYGSTSSFVSPDPTLGRRRFWSLETHMASAIEPLISTELHRILKAEWLSAYVEAHDKAFTVQNIQAGFCGTGILPYNPSKVIDRIKSPESVVQDCIEVRSSTPTEVTTLFTNSVLTSSPLNTEETWVANAALLHELNKDGPLSPRARNYAQKVVKRSERLQIRNIIIEEEHSKLKAAVTKRKVILSGKRKVIDGKHILTTPEILGGVTDAEKVTKKRKVIGAKKGKGWAREVVVESSDESEASQEESLVILNCIAVES